MDIEVARLGPGPLMRMWLDVVFADRDNRSALPDECRSDEWVYDLAARIDANRVVALMPAVDGSACGLYWGAPWEGGIWSVHQFVLKAYRTGWLPIKIARACVDEAFEAVPSCECLLGFTPRSFRAPYVTALRAGFADVGTMSGYYMHRGVALDCAIMTRRRETDG